MKLARVLLGLAAAAGIAGTAALVDAAPAAAQWGPHHHRHYRPHHVGPGFFFVPPRVVRRHCWTEYRMVRVETRWGWRWRERPVRICR